MQLSAAPNRPTNHDESRSITAVLFWRCLWLAFKKRTRLLSTDKGFSSLGIPQVQHLIMTSITALCQTCVPRKKPVIQHKHKHPQRHRYTCLVYSILAALNHRTTVYGNVMTLLWQPTYALISTWKTTLRGHWRAELIDVYICGLSVAMNSECKWKRKIKSEQSGYKRCQVARLRQRRNKRRWSQWTCNTICTTVG